MSKKTRKVLVLKENFKGMIVKRTIPKMGEVTMDTNAITAEEYPNYVRLGFGECFEEKEQVDASEEELEVLREKITKAPKESEEEEEEFEDMEDDDNEDDEEGEGDELEDKSEKVLTDGDALADLEGKERPDNSTQKMTLEGLMVLDWSAFKEVAKQNGESIKGRNRETIAASIVEKNKKA